MVDEQPEVPGALAKRRELQDRDREPVEEVFAEPAGGDLLGQRAVRRGDDAHVDLDRLGGADADDLAFLEHAQQLHLRGAGQLAELVEEERAAVGGLEVALALAAFAPVNAPFSWPKSSDSTSSAGIAPQFTAMKVPLAPRARAVDGAREQLLAGAGLALDEHRARCGPRRGGRAG